tara:strand:- start:100 stop:891 length:792 start_codon:yes stop_codon:yes gene_type:complete
MVEQEMSFLEMENEEAPVMQEEISNEQIGMEQYNQVLKKVVSRFPRGVPEIMDLIEEDEQDIRNFKENETELDNIFDEEDMESPENLTNFLPASVPGESLTGDMLDPKKGTLGKYPWESPPEINTVTEAFDNIVNNKNSNDSVKNNILKLLEGGVPAETLARTVSFKGFIDGLWTVDISELLSIPLIFEFVADAKDSGTDFRIFNDVEEDDINDESVLNIMKDFNPDKYATIQREADIMSKMPDKIDMMEEPVMGSFLDMESN